MGFILRRMRNDFIDRGYPYDVVDAVLGVQSHNPYAALRAVKGLTAMTQRNDWREILPAFSRCVRITRDQEKLFEISPDLLVEEGEISLFNAIKEAEDVEREENSVEDFFKVFLPIIPAINRFFDDVLVMSEDQQERNNRLGLLQRIVALGSGAADFSALEGF